MLLRAERESLCSARFAVGSLRIRVVFTQASSTSLHWRWTHAYNLSTGPADYVIVGTSTAGDGWMLGRTEQSPWFDFTDPCEDGDLCPLQNYRDFERHGDTLSITRHELRRISTISAACGPPERR